MSTGHDAIKSRRGIRALTVREAVLIAVLLHVIILSLPQSVNPFLFFQYTPIPAVPEPLNFSVTPPQENEPDLQAAPEEQDAVTPERTEAEPQTRDPQNEGITNLRRLEAPQSSAEATPPSSRPADIGSETVEPPESPVEPDIRPESQPDPERIEELGNRLAEAMRNPQFDLSDIPAVFDNELPTSADEAEGVIAFDTYEWDYIPYRDLLLLKLYRFWVPRLEPIPYFRMGLPGLTVYRFVIGRDGSLLHVQKLRPSEREQYDLAARYAIVAPYPGRIAAFPPLPDHFPKQTLTVTVAFYVNMRAPNRR